MSSGKSNSMSKELIPYIANMVLSARLLKLKRLVAERKRKLTKQPHIVTVYLALNDPYSYLLLQVLKDFQTRFSVEYDFRTVLNKQPDMFPAPKLWQQNAFKDGLYLADLYLLDFPATAPKSSPERDAQLTAQLLHWELQPGYLENALLLFNAYWLSDDSKDDGAIESLVSPAITHNVECYQQHLSANEGLLKDNGHYLSAMMHYGNEWYWGLDRLQYLERRFNDLGIHSVASNRADIKVNYDATHRYFCQRMSKQDISDTADKQPLELYLSIRSPYSYIALVRARQLANHYNIPLIVKPVLPMVMRRMQVPKNKTHYIARDASREAHQYNIAFGRIADPLGKGVENCYALYEFAQSQGKGVEFLESYARGVWSEGIRSDTEAGLKTLVERVGLNWQDAQPLLKDDNWRMWAQSNLAELYGLGLWGVPSFKYGDVKVFGQDRLDCIEQAIVSIFEKS